MPEEITKAEKARIDAVDKAVLAEATATREHELALRKSDNQRLIEIERIQANAAEDRRQRIGWALAGLAVVVVVLAGIAAIWTGVDRSAQNQLRHEQIQQQTAQACIQHGDIWLTGQGCLITQRDAAPAPRAS